VAAQLSVIVEANQAMARHYEQKRSMFPILN
jgi:hypothetical protein